MKSFLHYISEADEQPQDADYAGAPEHGGMTQPEMELYYQSWLKNRRKSILQKKPSKELENPEIAKMIGGPD
jgi:hypothetical protein